MDFKLLPELTAVVIGFVSFSRGKDPFGALQDYRPFYPSLRLQQKVGIDSRRIPGSFSRGAEKQP